jgi:hypothetical protein
VDKDKRALTLIGPAPANATCDRCGPGVRATVRATLGGGKLTLDFCNHHADEYKNAMLLAVGERSS